MEFHEFKDSIVITGPMFEEPVEVVLSVQRSDKTVFLMFRRQGADRSDSIVLLPEDVTQIHAPRHLNPPREHKPVVANGILTMPLYHGTSSLWYDSILIHGLGGKDIIQEFHVLELLHDLVQIFRTNSIEEPPGLAVAAAEKIANQFVGVRGWNYRHGSVYLSASPMKPAIYVFDNPLGSEAINYCVGLIRQAERVNPLWVEPLRRRISPLLDAVSQPAQPMIIEALDVPIGMLRDENGGPPDATLAEFEMLINRKRNDDFALIGQGIIFEAIGVIPVEKLRAFYLGPDYQFPDANVALVPFEKTDAEW